MFTVNHFKLIYNVIQTYFGEENVDLIDTSLLERETYYPTISEITETTPATGAIVIYFPEITLKNELGNTHILTDVYAALTRDAYFGVGRTSYTHQEATYGYSHSHTSPERDYTHMFRSFCLGSGNWADVIHYLQSIATQSIEVTEEELENTMLQFCYLLPQVLATESLKGGPYFRISELSNTRRADRRKCNYAVPKSAAAPFLEKYYAYVGERLWEYPNLKRKKLYNRLFRIWLKVLPFSQYLNELSIHTSLVPTILKLSSITLEEINKGTFEDLWPDKEFLINMLFTPTIIKNEQLYKADRQQEEVLFSFKYDKPIFKFKGQNKYISITKPQKTKLDTSIYCISTLVWETFLKTIFKNTVKYQYAEQ